MAFVFCVLLNKFFKILLLMFAPSPFFSSGLHYFLSESWPPRHQTVIKICYHQHPPYHANAYHLSHNKDRPSRSSVNTSFRFLACKWGFNAMNVTGNGPRCVPPSPPPPLIHVESLHFFEHNVGLFVFGNLGRACYWKTPLTRPCVSVYFTNGRFITSCVFCLDFTGICLLEPPKASFALCKLMMWFETAVCNCIQPQQPLCLPWNTLVYV